MIIPIPFFGLVEIEDDDGLEVANKTAVENNTASSNEWRINDRSTLETKSNEGTGNNL